MNPSSNTKLSIVIIGRNEAARIADCVDAAMTAAKQTGGAEVLYVDSHSTDGTVTIVRDLGVRAIALHQSLRRTPSAGRFWGSQKAKGKYILFIDADTLVYPDFLPKALDLMDTDETVAGINGQLDDLNEAGEKLYDIEERFDKTVDVKWLRGPCCLYRREAILAVGSFHPDLATEEEAELGLRLVRAGWKLKIVPVPMAVHTRCHHGQTVETIVTTFRRDIRSGRIGEITRAIFIALRAGNGLAFCWLRLQTTILFTAWLAVIAALFFLPVDDSYPVAGIIGVAVVGFLAIFWKKRSLIGTLLFVPSKVLSLIDIAIGLRSFRLRSPSHSWLLQPGSRRFDPSKSED